MLSCFSDGRISHPSAAILDSRTLQTPTSGVRAGYDGAKRKKGSNVDLAVDTLGHLLAPHVTPVNEQDRDHLGQLAQAIQEVSNQEVTLACVNQGYTGQNPANVALKHGIATRSGQASRGEAGIRAVTPSLCGRAQLRLVRPVPPLVRDYGRLPETLAGLHYLAFACLMLPHVAGAMDIVQNML